MMLAGAFACQPARAAITVSLTTGSPPAVPVGKPVSWTATVTPSGGSLLYQFSATAPNGVSSVVRDYSPLNTLEWTSLHEGNYTVHVSAMDTANGDTAQAQAPIQYTAIVTAGGAPKVSATANPLVALYSAPPCTAGAVEVSFVPVNGAEPAMKTSAQACKGANASLNFYIAGMLEKTTYQVQQFLLLGGKSTPGPTLSFTTGTPKLRFPASTVIHPPDGSTSATEVMLLTSFVGHHSFPGASDLAGHPLWYYDNIFDTLDTDPFLTRMTPTPSAMLLLFQGPNRRQVFREVDMAGNLIRETDSIALNQQLAAKGLGSINWLSHEALRLPNGHTLLLASTERLLNNVQGPGNVDVVGDMILDLDTNLQLTWSWNAFNFLPTSRKAILGETCTSDKTCGGPLHLAKVANDWTHCNSLYYMNDGSLILSSRNQDWILKVNYQSGAGDGSIIWTLGNEGDFAIQSTDPWPWFSHQHDVEFDGTNYEMFDDGNTRVSPPPLGLGSGNSRGYVLSVDETHMTATPLMLADMGSYSQWWGTAQLLANGNYNFLSGCLGPAGTTLPNCLATSQPTGQAIEMLPGGIPNYNIIVDAHAYRAFRIKDLYTYVP